MNADFYLTLQLKGTTEEIFSMLKIANKYLFKGEKDTYFNFTKVNDKFVEEETITEDFVKENTKDDTFTITANGPYGKYCELNDVEIFRDIALDNPTLSFKANINGNRTYDDQSLDCELKDGILTIDTYYKSYEDAEDAWIKDFKEKLPLKKFKSIFKIKGNIDDDEYSDLLCCIESDYVDNLEEMSYEDLEMYLEDYDVEFNLDEDNFEKAIEKMMKTGVVSSSDYENEYYEGESSYYEFDAKTGEYLKNSDKIVKYNTVENANDIIKAGLRAQGLDDSDEALGKLTIDEAYAAFALGNKDNE